MKIAADPKIANAARAQLLPPAWGALYELTKLPVETFEQAVTSCAIHPGMTREGAEMGARLFHVCFSPNSDRKSVHRPVQ